MVMAGSDSWHTRRACVVRVVMALGGKESKGALSLARVKFLHRRICKRMV